MKKILGVTVLNGEIQVIEVESFKCRCISGLLFAKPTVVGARILNTFIFGGESDKEFEEDKIYDYAIDQNDDNTITNYYIVFISDGERNNFTKEQFYEHFIPVDEYRNNQIEEILK